LLLNFFPLSPCFLISVFLGSSACIEKFCFLPPSFVHVTAHIICTFHSFCEGSWSAVNNQPFGLRSIQWGFYLQRRTWKDLLAIRVPLYWYYVFFYCGLLRVDLFYEKLARKGKSTGGKKGHLKNICLL
jgi:hypothetical protein